MPIRGGIRSALSSVVTVALVATGIAVGVAGPAAAAEPAPAISVSKLLTQQVDDPTVDNSILIGDSVRYTVRVSNSGAAGVGRAYNVSVRDVLPAGVSYKATSSTIGEPTIIANAPSAGQTTLLWRNLFDVSPGGEQEFTYEATPDPKVLPVGSTFSNAATGYATNDPFDVTDFGPTGQCTQACSYTDGDSVSTVINAVALRKDELNSPEKELVRGVHDNATVYALRVTNNRINATNGLSLIDYLPPQQEFLGCGGVDNTAGDLREWTQAPLPSPTQAPRLTVVPAPPSDCLTPASVDTVTIDPPGPAPFGLYTRVLWSLGDLAPSASIRVTYRAGIPMFANTMTWPNGKPLSTSLRQGSNLDNNLGADTSEQPGSEASLTNYAMTVGRYQGPNNNGTNPAQVFTFNRDIVTAEDLAIDKSVSPSTFSIGGTATYTLRVRTSEYRTAGLTSFADRLPDGLTINGGAAGTGLAVASATLSTPAGSTPATVTFDTTSYAAGPQALTFTVADSPLPTNATLTIVITARMEAAYSDGAPTAAGDSYENVVQISGTTTPAVCPNVPPGPSAASVCADQPVLAGVSDSSTATLTSGGTSLDKTIGQDPANRDCTTQDYGDAIPSPPFQIGDIICFQLTADLSDGALNNVLSPVLQDFLPSNIAYVAGSAAVVPAGTNLPDDQIRFDGTQAPGTGGGSLLWVLGEPVATNPSQLVTTPQGGVSPRITVRFAARVVSTVLDQNKDIQGNLLKATSVDSNGQAQSSRDQQDFALAGSQVTMVKGIKQVERNGSVVQGPFGPNVDGKTVQGGDVVTFRVDVTNTGLAGAGSNVPVRRVRVTDVLPAPFTCAVVENISNGGTCTGSTITWEYTGPGRPESDVAIDAGETATLTYDTTVPSSVLVGRSYVNTATVPYYQSLSNTGWVDNVPIGVTDNSNVVTPPAALTKTGITSIVSKNNNEPNQFTVGEKITYTVDATVPAGTSLASGAKLSDAVPAGLQYVAGTGAATYSADGPGGPFGALPAGAAFTDGGPDWITFAGGFTNSSATKASVFRLRFTAIVLGSTYTHNQQITNRATFAGQTAQYSARVVIPNPVIAKSNSATGPVLDTDTITYRLTVTNPSVGSPARPTSFDTVVVDCLPAGMTFLDYGPLPTGVTTGTSDGATCGAGATRLSWVVGSVVTGSSVELSYTARVSSGAPASTSFVNTATVTGSTLDTPDDPLNPAIEGVYSSKATSTVRTSNGTIDKSVSPLQAAPGQQVTWTITTTYQAGLSFYDAVVKDTLPAGIDPTSVAETSHECTDGTEGTEDTGACAAIDAQWNLTQSGSDLSWSIGDIGQTEADVVVTIRYTANVTGGNDPVLTAGTVLTNTASSVYATDSNGTPVVTITATASLVITRPVLVISKYVSTETPTPGDLYQYTVTVGNESGDLSSPAFDVVVEDQVPDGVIVKESTISEAGTITGATATGGGVVTWHLPGPLEPGAAPVELTYLARLVPSATAESVPNSWTNTASVPEYLSCREGYPPPPRPDHATLVCGGNGDAYTAGPATATVTAGTPSADLAIVKTPSGSTTPGSTWTFQMDVTNNGPSDAQAEIVVTDTLPAGMTYLSSGPDWTCGSVDQVVSCTLVPEATAPDPAGLAANETAPPLVLSVQIADQPANASYTNVATVESTTTADPKPENNSSQATVTVSPTPVPPDPDPGKPVDPENPVGVRPPTPVDPTNPERPVVPPVKPPVVPQKPSKPLPLPETIKPFRPTVVLPAGVKTNAGQPVRAIVQCRPLYRWVDKVAISLSGQWVPLGDVRYCDVRTSKNGKVTVTTTYPGQVLVKVTYYAKKVPGYTPFVKVKRWIVTPR